MNIEEMAENLYRVQYAACAGHAAEVALIAATLRECLAKSAGAELATTALIPEVEPRLHQPVVPQWLWVTQFAKRSIDDIDTLITALAERDAEIERFRPIAEAAVEFVKASEAIQSATLDNMASALGMENEAYDNLKSAIDGGK